MNKTITCIAILCSLFFTEASAQPKLSLNPGIDIASRYVWRGLDYGQAPSLQPCLELAKGGFALGIWGAYSTSGSYAEADVYASFTWKNWKLTAFDYFTLNDTLVNKKYFDLNNETTGHTLEMILEYGGPDHFPLQLLIGTMVFGNDKKEKIKGTDTTYTNSYSTYIEAGYTFTVDGNDLEIFTGGLLNNSLYYGLDAGIINLGLKASREIKISDHFSIPLEISLSINPKNENIFLTAMVSF